MDNKKHVDMLGQTFISNNGCKAFVVEYVNNKQVRVKFIDSDGYLLWTSLSALRSGLFKNPFHRSVRGIGYMGDTPKLTTNADFKINNNWHNMIARCYSNITEGFESYREKQVYISDSWHNFHNFYLWSLPRYVDGYSLDKDLLSAENDLVYSEDTCIYLPQRLNAALAHMKTAPSIKFLRDRYYPRIIIDGKSTSLGGFPSKLDAQNAYKEEKSKIILSMFDEYRHILPDKACEAALEKVNLYLLSK